MVKRLLLLFLLAFPFSIVFSQPLNSDCDFATNIPIVAGAGCSGVFNNTGTPLVTTGGVAPCLGITGYCNFFTFVATGTNNTINITGSTAGSPEVTYSSFGCEDPITGIWTVNGCSTTMPIIYSFPIGTVVTVQVCTPNIGSYNVCINSVTPPPVGVGSTCDNAYPICNNSPFTVSSFPAASDQFILPCGGFTNQPIYMTFTAASSGTIGFLADPIGLSEYDWVIYDLTANGGCAGYDPEFDDLCCNYNYTMSAGAPIGFGASGTGFCGIDIFGFNSDEIIPPIPAISGHQYLIVIDNFDFPIPSGFNFTWSGTMAFNPTFTASPTTGCNSVTATFTPSATAGYAFDWDFDDGTSSSTAGVVTHTFSTPGTYVVTLTTTSTSGCVNVSSQTITVGSTTNPTVTSPVTYCLGATSTPLTATGFGLLWYTTPAGGVGSATAPTPSTATLGSTTYYVSQTVAGCESGREPIVVDIIDLPTVSIATPAEITCSIPSVTLTGSSATAGVTYTWSGPAAFSATGATTSVSAVGTYTLTVATAGCSNTATITVTDDVAPPIATIATPSSLDCVTSSVSLDGSASTPAGVTYAWTGPGGYTSLTSIATGVSTPGVYSLVVTDPSNGCSSITTTTTVVSASTPPIANAGSSQTLTCSISSVNLDGSLSTPAGVTYSWTGPAGFTSLLPNPSVSSVGVYTLVVTDPANGCSSTPATVSVTIDNVLPIANAGSNQTLTCALSSVSLNGSASTPVGVAYTWTGPGGFSSALPNPNVSSIGTYTLVVTDPANGCTSLPSTVDVINDSSTPTAIASVSGDITCINASVDLDGTGSSVGLTYSWSGPSGFSSALLSPLGVTVAGTYTLTVTDPVNSCSSTATVNVLANTTTPIASAIALNQIDCINLAADIDASSSSAGMQYDWTGPAGFTSTSQNISALSNAGIYSLLVTDPINGCTDNTSVTIISNTTPPIADAGSDVTLTCASSSVDLDGSNSSSGMTYQWQGPGGYLSILQNPIGLTNVGIYTLTVTDASNGCSSLDNAEILVDSSLPLAMGIATGTLDCSVSITGIDASASSAGMTYLWAGPGGYSSLIQSPTDISVAGVYTLTVTDPANGCVANANITVTENITLPVAVATTLGTISCSTPTISIDGTGSSIGMTYSWSGPGAYTSLLINPSDITLAGIYTLTVTDPVNGCSNTATTTVTATAIPPVASAVPLGMINCSGSPITIDGSASSLGLNYAWSGPAAYTSSSLSPTDITTTGVYTLTVTDPANGCSQTTTVNVLLDNTPPIAVALGGSLTCGASTTFLDATGSTAGSYQWTGPGGYSSSLANPTDISIAGTYTLTVTDLSNFCTSTANVTISSSSAGPDANAGSDVEITCSTPTPLIIGSSTVPGVTYLWTGPSGYNDPNAAVLVSNAGVYTLTVTDPSTGCNTIDFVNVTLNNTQPTANAGLDQTIDCNTTNVDLAASSSSSNPSYTWNGPLGSITTPILNTSVAGTYTLTVLDIINGCTNTDIVEVFANNTAPAVTLPPIADICSLSLPIVLTGATPVGGTYTINGNVVTVIDPSTLGSGSFVLNYTYTDPLNGCSTTEVQAFNIVSPALASVTFLNDTLCLNQGAMQLIGSPTGGVFTGSPLLSADMFDPTVVGVHTINYQINSSTPGCSDDTTFNIVVMPSPVPDIAVENGCVGEDITIEYIGDTNISTLTWDYDDASYASNINGFGPTILQFNNGGFHTITATVSNAAGCTSSISESIAISEWGINTIENTSIYWGENVSLNTAIYPMFNNAGTSVLWTPNIALDCDTCETPVAAPIISTWYYVTLTDSLQCTYSDSVFIMVNVDYETYIPNAFSPNGDGVNDVFQIYGKYIDKVNMTIYNRWGEKVFESQDINTSWDGTFMGKACDPAVYKYVCNIQFVDGRQEIAKGNLTIIR